MRHNAFGCRLLSVCRPASILAVLASVACGSNNRERDPVSYTLEEVTRYGWDSLADSTGPLSDGDRAADGAVLGLPLDVAEGPDGKVYVVDAAYQKVVVFEADGSFSRLVLGGAGRGPGEFSRPRSIAVDERNRVWVYDQIENRVTEFDPAGNFVRLFNPKATNILDIVVSGDRLYATRFAPDSTPRVAVFDTTGTLVADLLRAGPQDFEIGVYTGGGLGQALDDCLIFGFPRAGRWRRVCGFEEGPTLGKDLHPSDRSKWDEERGVHESPVETWAAGQLPNGIVYIIYNHKTPNERTFKLALFDSTGTHLQTLPVAARGGTFGASNTSPDVFVLTNEPYPQILRLRLRPSQRASTHSSRPSEMTLRTGPVL